MAGLQTLLPPEVLAHVALYVFGRYSASVTNDRRLTRAHVRFLDVIASQILADPRRDLNDEQCPFAFAAGCEHVRSLFELCSNSATAGVEVVRNIKRLVDEMDEHIGFWMRQTQCSPPRRISTLYSLTNCARSARASSPVGSPMANPGNPYSPWGERVVRPVAERARSGCTWNSPLGAAPRSPTPSPTRMVVA